MEVNILFKSLHAYYDKTNYSKLLNTLDRKNNEISLRLIDWFTTNYAKKNNTRVKNQSDKSVNVYVEYKNQLKAFSKKQFDPFCRRERITFNKYGQYLETTLGQLNFFRWAIQNNIVDYVQLHNRKIENDMLHTINQSPSNSKGVKRNNIITTRKELSSCATKCFTCIQLNSVIVLD